MKRRRPGLQNKWAYVVKSLGEIIPSYEKASSRISLFADRKMRAHAVSSAVRAGYVVLDLGAGPGTMSRLVSAKGGEPVLLDVSRPMLRASGFENVVQGTFESLPFRRRSFDAAVSGFALRDAQDLNGALAELTRVLKPGGHFSFCDLGKPDSQVEGLLIGYYLRVLPNVIAAVTTGRLGFQYGSIFDTYILALRNSDLAALLSKYFARVELTETQFGGSIVVDCVV